MTAHSWFYGLSIALVFSAILVGCTKENGSTPDAVAAESHHEGDGHDHSAGEHPHVGPHGGHLIELGSNEAFHAELLHDEATHRVTVYVLDGAAKANVPVPQPELVVNIVSGGTPKQFKLPAMPQADERRDMASCFQVENEELCAALDATDCKGRLAININGKQYVGEIENHDHEGHAGENQDEHERK